MTGDNRRDDAGAPSRLSRLAARATSLVARFKKTRPGRAVQRYSSHRGNVLAGGVAYNGLLSVAAAVVVGSTLAAVVVGRAPSLRDALLRFLGRTIPGIVKGADGGSGLIDASSLSAKPITSVVSLIALLIGLNTASRYVGALRAAMQVMLGHDAHSALRGKARDAVALGSLALMALLAASIQVAAASAATWIGADNGGRTVAVRVVAVVATLAVDGAFVFVAMTVLGGAGRPYRALLPAVGAAAVAIAVLRSVSSLVLGASISNPILAPFAAVIAILVWVDLVTRIVLLAAAWVGSDRPVRAP